MNKNDKKKRGHKSSVGIDRKATVVMLKWTWKKNNWRSRRRGGGLIRKAGEGDKGVKVFS